MFNNFFNPSLLIVLRYTFALRPARIMPTPAEENLIDVLSAQDL